MEIGGNGNDSMGVGREWEQESHSSTPRMRTVTSRSHLEISKHLSLKL